MSLKKDIACSSFLIGLSSMLGQIFLLRALLTIFYGNELAIGVILASWLFWTSIGGLLGARLKANIGLILVFNALILPPTLFVAGFLPKVILGSAPGEIIGIFPMIGFSFLLLAPICVLLGAGWAVICKMATDKAQIGSIYMYEGIGAAIAGLLFNFVLAKYVSPYISCFILSGLNLFLSVLLFKRLILRIALAFLLLVEIASILFHYPAALEQLSRRLRFSPFEVISSKDSIYGNVTLTKYGKHGFQYSLFENGLHLFTTKDILTQEETSHYPLLQHPDPKIVLLIGGGLGGTIDELLKHPIERLDYCELDPLVIVLAKKYLPEEELRFINNPKVNIHHIDGRLFIKNSAKNVYDVIIINLPEPFTAQVNRFYSLEFFKEAEKILKPNGVLSFGIVSSENYISPQQGQLLASIFKTLALVFADVKVFPGDTNLFFGSKYANHLTYDPGLLIARLKNRGVLTQYVASYAKFKLEPNRISYLKTAIKTSKDAKLNLDFAPIGYFYDMVLWSSHFSSKALHLFNLLYKMNILHFIGLIIIGFAFLLCLFWKNNKDLPVYTSILTTGTSELVFQIVVILAFQVIYGYAYYKMGLIFGSFMAGLVLGSILINKNLARLKNRYLVYMISQAVVVVYPLILPAVFFLLSALKHSLEPSLIEIVFIVLPSIAGFIGGWQFPLANNLCSGKDYAKTASRLYAFDLLGSCLGALFASSVLLPILGIPQTCVLLSFINLIVLLLLFAKYLGAKD